MMIALISAGFLFIYALLIFYYWRAWQKIPDFQLSGNGRYTAISVVVPVRNEEKNIIALLAALQNQSYPKDSFEIIIADDFSTDNTVQLAKNFRGANIIIVQPALDPAISSKKKAIEKAVAVAGGELIIATDADCVPGIDWLRVINEFYLQTGAAFIAAPVKFFHNTSLLETFQAIDFLTLQGITAASVAAGFHNMCNGANLAYRKESFINVKGYEGIDSIATGDDMLLMHKIWKLDPSKIFYLKSRKAVVITGPMFTWRDFFMQRKRWASKALVYEDHRIILVLAFVYLLNCLFVVLLSAAIFNSYLWQYAVGFWVLKTVIEFPFVHSVAKFYREEKLLKYFFFFQPLHMIYTVFVGLVSQFGKYEWKGRKTK